MPAIVRTADDELVEVATTADFAKAKRFWINLIALPLMGAVTTAVIWAIATSQQIHDQHFQYQQDSLAVGGFKYFAEQVHANTKAISDVKSNLDSTLTLSHQILHYVSKKP